MFNDFDTQIQSDEFEWQFLEWRRNMEMNTKKKIDRRIFKKSPDELQEYMMFKRRGSRTPAKKGKGMKYERAQEKEKSRNLVSDN